MTEALNLKLKRVLHDPDAPPTAAHKFMWTRVGTDICFEVGFFDLPELREAVERAKQQGTSAEPIEVALHLSGRYVLSPQAVADLSQVVKELEADMKTLVVPAPEGVR